MEHNQEIEDRIIMEIVVDAYDEEEQTMGWYSYLEEKLHFPFKAKCIEVVGGSPLLLGEIVEVIGIGNEESCSLHRMFVEIQWKDRELDVTLSQLEGVGVDEDTKEAINDWHYWIFHE